MVFPLLLTLLTPLGSADPALTVYSLESAFAAPPSWVTRAAPPLSDAPPSSSDDSSARGAAERTIVSSDPDPHKLANAAAGLDRESLIHMEEVILDEIRRGGFPGAALAVGIGDQVVLERGIGRTGWDPGTDQVDPHHTMYDLASLTKVVATTTAVMILVEDGRMSLDDPVVRYLPEFNGDGKVLVTIRHLLTHTSGLPAWANVSAPTPRAARTKVMVIPLDHLPGERVEYSDLGFVVLWEAAKRAAAEPLYPLLDQRVFGPLGMRRTTFRPGVQCVTCAPTLRRSDGSMIQGRVHDPIAHWLGGIAGNAGLFSTAHDLARFAAMMANGGVLDSVRVLRAETIRQFTRRQPGAGTRTLGWEVPDPDGSGAAGLLISPRAFGHTGFTGTSMWIDPDRGTWTILLSNRTFAPRASYAMQELRRNVHGWVATAYDTGAVLVSAESDAATAAR